MVFHWSLSDIKSQVSRTRLRILAVLSNALIWIVSSCPPTSKSSRPFNNPFVIVPKAPITIGTIVTFMFLSFFNSLARSRYSSFFSHSFRFILWSAGTAKSMILQILFFLLIIVRSGLLAGIRWSVLLLLQVFHKSFYGWFYTDVWVTVYFHGSPWLLYVFTLTLTLLWSGYCWFILWFQVPQDSFLCFWGTFQGNQLQFIPSSLSHYIFFI